MTDIEVRDDRRPREGRRDRTGPDRKRHDRRPEGTPYHEHVAAIEPAMVAAAPEAETPRPEAKPRPARAERQPERPREKRERPRNQREYNAQAAQPEPVDKSQLPAFLFRPVPVKKPVPQAGE
jgi:hypothetical protein